MKKSAKALLAGTAAIGLAVAGAPTTASELCFAAFGGSVHYQFETTVSALQTQGTQPLTGRVFGALRRCAGLSEWPLVGGSITTSNTVILGYRAMTVDASSCGAVDNIVSLN